MYVYVNSFNQFHVIGHLDCFRYFATFNGVASNNTFTATSFNNSLVFSYDVLPKIVLLSRSMHVMPGPIMSSPKFMSTRDLRK